MKPSKRLIFGMLGIGAGLALQPGVSQQMNKRAGWQQELHSELPLLGHRNWILIVDSAYPLQTSPGVRTIKTNADQIDVVRAVLTEVNRSIHVRPALYMDAELPFVQESEAPGVSIYKERLASVLNSQHVTALPHEQIISKIDEAGRTFHVLVLKTNLAVPYTSVFVQLNCKYWGDAAEAALREKMHAQPR